MAYQINCDDGFFVKSEDEEEVLDMMELHIKNMHPDQTFSRGDLKEVVQTD